MLQLMHRQQKAEGSSHSTSPAEAAASVAQAILRRELDAALQPPLGSGSDGGDGNHGISSGGGSSSSSNASAGSISSSRQGQGQGQGQAQAPLLSLQDSWADAVQALAQRLLSENSVSGHDASASLSQPATSGGGGASLRLQVREVVEVKNHCPFMFRQARWGLATLGEA